MKTFYKKIIISILCGTCIPITFYAQRDFNALFEQSNLTKRIPQAPCPINVPYILTISTPTFGTDLEDTPLWRVYFQGSIVKDRDGIFQIIAPNSMDQLSIVVALLSTPKETNIQSLMVAPGNPFTIYSIKKRKSAPHLYTWDVEITKGTNGLAILPFSLIILMDPSIIHSVTSPSWNDRDASIPLPTFTLRKDKNLTHEYEKGMLNALDLDPFHSNTYEKTMVTVHETNAQVVQPVKK